MCLVIAIVLSVCVCACTPGFLSLSLSVSNVCVSLCICTRLSVFAELLPGKARGGAPGAKNSKPALFLFLSLSLFFFLKQRKPLRSHLRARRQEQEVGGWDLLPLVR